MLVLKGPSLAIQFGANAGWLLAASLQLRSNSSPAVHHLVHHQQQQVQVLQHCLLVHLLPAGTRNNIINLSKPLNSAVAPDFCSRLKLCTGCSLYADA